MSSIKLSDGSDYGSDIDIDIDIPQHLYPTINGPASDYGTDIDLSDTDLLSLLDNPPATPAPPSLYPQISTSDDSTGVTKACVEASTRFRRDGTLAIQYDEPITAAHPIATTEEATATLTTISDAQPEADPADTIPPIAVSETRSPYDRFRSRRGRLSVTDLISGVWCEQQFMYTLERGFKRRTPAMKAGTKLHKALEEEVHIDVPVRVTTKEDVWGLKLFNMFQGLVSLEEKGMTRELEVFGWLGGVFVNGIIDEITYNRPNPKTLEKTQDKPQTPISDTGDDPFTTCPSSPVDVTSSLILLPARIAYITDTKTRANRTIPSASQQLSTSLQLTLYRTLLTSLPSIPFHLLLQKHKLSPTAPFSDSFIAQITSIESPLTLTLLLANNSLSALWSIFLEQYHKTIGGVGDMVGVTYRFQRNGEVIGERSWKVEEDVGERHLVDVMSWWRGERETRGVEIEEAWKCRMCEFEETCSWRLGKLEEIRRVMKGTVSSEEKKADTVVSTEVKVKEVKERKRGKRGPRKNAQNSEEAVGTTESEDTDSGGVEVSIKGESRGQSTPKGVGQIEEGGGSIAKLKRGRGRPKKQKPSGFDGIDIS